MIYIKFIPILVIIMLLIDALWIGVVMKSFYRSNLGFIMSDTVNWLPAIIFYVLYIAGLLFFVVLPGVHGGLTFGQIFLRGAFFGLVAYGTYDLTNHATLKNWPYIVTLIDMVWGGFLTGVMSIIGKYLSKFII